jgi:hypothetical protein
MCRLLFQGLWCLADRTGKLECRPARIKAEVFPYDDITKAAIITGLDQLHSRGFIVIYNLQGITCNAADITGIIKIPQFSRHQSPHKNEINFGLKDMETKDLEELQVITGNYTMNHESCMRNDEGGISNEESLLAQSEPCAEKVVKKSKTGKTIMVEYTDRFELFWSAFPQRKQESGTMTRGSKQKAFQEWQKYNLDAKDQNPEAELITKAAKYYKVDKPRDAERWLRDRGWQDGCGKVVQPKPGSWKPKEKAL